MAEATATHPILISASTRSLTALSTWSSTDSRHLFSCDGGGRFIGELGDQSQAVEKKRAGTRPPETTAFARERACGARRDANREPGSSIDRRACMAACGVGPWGAMGWLAPAGSQSVDGPRGRPSPRLCSSEQVADPSVSSRARASWERKRRSCQGKVPPPWVVRAANQRGGKRAQRCAG